MPATVRVQRWGNSLALRLPREVAEAAGVREGTPVLVDVHRGAVRARAVHRYRLEELLRAVRRDNLHDEAEWGDAVGREAW